MPFGLGFFAAAGAGTTGGSAFELIQTVNVSSTQASISFTSIPQTYRHLQIRFAARNSDTTFSISQVLARFNGVSSNSYPVHELRGRGGAVESTYYGISTAAYLNYMTTQASAANVFAPGIVDILDYSSTTKNKTVRAFNGSFSTDSPNGIFPVVTLTSSLFLSTNAITSMVLTGSFVAGTRFSLYGIRG